MSRPVSYLWTLCCPMRARVAASSWVRSASRRASFSLFLNDIRLLHLGCGFPLRRILLVMLDSVSRHLVTFSDESCCNLVTCTESWRRRLGAVRCLGFAPGGFSSRLRSAPGCAGSSEFSRGSRQHQTAFHGQVVIPGGSRSTWGSTGLRAVSGTLPRRSGADRVQVSGSGRVLGRSGGRPGDGEESTPFRGVRSQARRRSIEVVSACRCGSGT